MHLLKIDKANYIGQADPYILESRGRFYIYTTGDDGVYAYESDTLLGDWRCAGKVFSSGDHRYYWAPSVIELDGTYYLYCSFECPELEPDRRGHHQAMHVAESRSPLGPFTGAERILPPFSIDSHIVRNESGLFLFYSTNRYDVERPGTCIVVDRMKDPRTPEGDPALVVSATLDEEIFMHDRWKKGENWHTIEGAFYFREGDWQYVMYSGNCYQQPTYYVGYARARTDETDLRKIRFEKYPDERTYAPVLAANEFEEGTGHHSMIKSDGVWYAVYHARDRIADGLPGDRRNARICRMHVEDGVITAERYADHI